MPVAEWENRVSEPAAVVVTYDPIGEGERNSQRKSGTRQHDRDIEPPEMGRRMGGLMMTDLMQAVGYLAQRPDVDSSRLAAMGYSMGSFVLGLACAVETRLNACVLAAGGDAGVLFMPVDMQDPPELIPDFVKHWESGCEIVYGIRAEREYRPT